MRTGPEDLKPLDFSKELESVRRLQMARTSPEHREGIYINTPQYRSQEQKDFFERKPVGNRVNIEEQMRRLDENAFQYGMTTDLYRKTAKLFKTAIGNQ